METTEPKIYLETERLILREFGPDDAANLLELDSDPEVRRYVDQPNPPTPESAARVLGRFLDWQKKPGQYGYFAAIEKATGAFLGWFHFRPTRELTEAIEIGWRLKQAAWGKGYATEGARAILRKGFLAQSVQRVAAEAMTENVASIRVMQKIGLRFGHEFVYDNRLPCVWYVLDRDDYLRQRQNESEQIAADATPL